MVKCPTDLREIKEIPASLQRFPDSNLVYAHPFPVPEQKLRQGRFCTYEGIDIRDKGCMRGR